MRIDVFTLFPEWFDWFVGQRHVRNALRLGHDLRLFNYRDTTPLGAGQVDDSPYGGGAGMVIRVDVVDAALKAVYGPDTGAMLAGRRVAVLAASGRPLDDAVAEELAGLDEITLLCGRYEGIDERIVARSVDREISIGDYVTSGGELPAMVLMDCIVRRLPGSLNDAQSAAQDSFSAGLLDWPHYTRPEEWNDAKVPDVLLSGNHAAIARWRRKQALGRTWDRRPDLVDEARLTREDRQLLEEYRRERQASQQQQ